jgi:hypothetical protein
MKRKVRRGFEYQTPCMMPPARTSAGGTCDHPEIDLDQVETLARGAALSRRAPEGRSGKTGAREPVAFTVTKKFAGWTWQGPPGGRVTPRA